MINDSVPASTIHARDFDTHSPHGRDVWTGGQLRHLIAALGDTPVNVVLDVQSGHTMVNVRLAEVKGDGLRIRVESTHVDGSTTSRWHSACRLGGVTIVGPSTPRWAALDSYDRERHAANTKTRAEVAAAHGVEDPASLNGECVITQRVDEVVVRFRPSPANRQGLLPRVRRFTPAELVELVSS